MNFASFLEATSDTLAMFLNKDDDGGSFLALFLKKESNGSRERSKQGLKKVNLTTSRFEQERD